MLEKVFGFEYVREVRRRCREKQELPPALFETYVVASLISPAPGPEMNLLVSDDLFTSALSFGRESSVAKRLCSEDELVSESSGDIVIVYGGACFAAGSETESFAISFSDVRGCPNGLEF